LLGRPPERLEDDVRLRLAGTLRETKQTVEAARINLDEARATLRRAEQALAEALATRAFLQSLARPDMWHSQEDDRPPDADLA
jgi:hypothetical protein